MGLAVDADDVAESATQVDPFLIDNRHRARTGEAGLAASEVNLPPALTVEWGGLEGDV